MKKVIIILAVLSFPAFCQNVQKIPDIEMVFVQGGTFMMGCTAEQQGDCKSNERPVHSVTVSSFNIGKYPVTQGQWKTLMGTDIRQQRDKAGLGSLRGEGDNYPMYYVSWYDAQEFIRRLNAVTGKNYRLPTESEWEYAARGGARSQGYKYSGSNKLYEVGWFDDKDARGSRTRPVDSKQPNELGIYDMSGNVWEWCSDWYGAYTASPKRDPTGASSGSTRVNRGGSWARTEDECRVSSRDDDLPENRGSGLGFRIVLPCEF